MSNTVEVKLAFLFLPIASIAIEGEAWLGADAFVDGRLAEIGEKTPGGARGGERLAMMAALNLAHEFLAAKNTPADIAAALESETIQRRIDSIEAKLDESLAQHEQLF